MAPTSMPTHPSSSESATAEPASLKPSAKFETLEQEAYIRLTRAQDALAADFNALFKEHGLSQPLFNVLRIVRGAGPEGLPSQQIGRRLIHRDPDVTRLVDRLQKAGFVARQRSMSDRRVVRVAITDAGRAKLTELDPVVREIHRDQLGHFCPARLAQLNTLLAEVLEGTRAQRRSA